MAEKAAEGDAKRVRAESQLAPTVKVCSHPIIQHKLTQLRRAETSAKHFRELLSEITLFLGFEATKDLTLEDLVVETTTSKATGHALASKISLVPIMRGGLGLVDPMLTILPMATVYHIGLYNNPESLLPVLYYNKLPSECNSDAIYILDVQIGSGATLVATLDIIKEWCGQKKAKIKVISLVSSRIGLAKVSGAHPDVEFVLAAIDDSSETGLPLPGIGDPGNRLYGCV